ncbi:MAG: ScpA family protein [Methanomicrobiales archaeon]|nr:ScpA family protein [Methanomicrobiales archaeon]
MDEEPVEILVALAEKGEIDPWNIDIVEVTDRFLEELERRKELDLRISGRTLFFAATLLRIKSDYLGEPRDESDDVAMEFGEEDSFESASYEYGDPVDRLEREIERRLDRRSMRQAPVTLYELIQMLKTAEKAERRRRKVHAPSLQPLIFAEDVVAIAHREDYRETAEKVLVSISRMRGSENEAISLQELSRLLGWSIADSYLPLLFLALDGKICLRQEEFFSDLYITLPGLSEPEVYDPPARTLHDGHGGNGAVRTS